MVEPLTAQQRLAKIESRIAYVGRRAYSTDDIGSRRAQILLGRLEKLQEARGIVLRQLGVLP